MVTSASSILASMAKYYWILSHLSLLLSRLKHSFICKGVQGKCKGVQGKCKGVLGKMRIFIFYFETGLFFHTFVTL